jgi:hypothetical protein
LSTAVIYIYRCIIDNRVYVGGTKNFSNRKYLHLKKLRSISHSNKYLQAAFNCCGEENFIFEVIEICDYAQKFEREAYWINCYNALHPSCGFNRNAPSGHRHEAKKTDITPYIQTISFDDIKAICECDWLSDADIAKEVGSSELYISILKQKMKERDGLCLSILGLFADDEDFYESLFVQNHFTTSPSLP